MKSKNHKRSLPQPFSIFCVILLLVIESVELLDPLSANRSLKEAKEFTAEVGTDISINCTATEAEFVTYSEVRKGVVIVWKWKPQDSAEWVYLKNERLGDSQKQLGSQNKVFAHNQKTRKTVISNLFLYNVAVNSSGLYGCFFKESKAPLDQTELSVGYPPDKPELLRCFTDPYLQYMNCSWNVGRPTYINTTYQVFYNITKSNRHRFHTSTEVSSSGNVIYNTTCTVVHFHEEKLNGSNYSHSSSVVAKSSSVVRCRVKTRISLPRPETYHSRLHANNALGSNSSILEEILPNNRVILTPPTNVRISAFGDTDETRCSSLFVTWIKPEGSSHLNLLYKIRSRRTEYEEKWTEEEVHKNEVILTHLSQSTCYDVQVLAFHNAHGLLGGSNSDWSEVVSNSTQFCVPPDTFLFDSISATSSPEPSDRWEVKLLWVAYTHHYEPGFNYKVSYTMFGKTHQLTPLENRATFLVNGYGSIVIAGSFCNSKGCSPATYETTDLKKTLPITDDVRLSLQSSNAPEINWKTDVTDQPDENECIVRLCSSVRDPDGFYSIFTVDVNSTNESVSACNFDANHDVLTNCSAGQLIMPRVDVSPCQQYYAIVLRSSHDGIFNILTSSTSSNIITRNPVITTTGNFSATDGSSQAHYQINTEWAWKETVCTNLHKDLFFSVVYTPISGAECSESNSCQGNRPFHSLIGNCSQAVTYHEITSNIYGATNYDLGLGYCCKPTATSSSTLCFAASNVTDQVDTRIGEPGIPVKLHWNVSDNTVNATWLPPTHPNGPLDGYKVKYGRKLNSSSGESGTINDSDFTEIITTRTSINLPIQCSSDDENAAHWVNVTAFNHMAEERLYGETGQLQGTACAVLNLDASWSGYVSIIVGVTFCLVFVVIFLLVGHYYRKRLKKMIRNSLWPPVPIPNVFIDLPTNTESNEFSKGLPSNGVENHSNPLFTRDRDTESIQSHESPDNIRDINDVMRNKDNNKEHSKPETALESKISSIQKPCCGISNYAMEKEQPNSARHYPSEDQYDGSEHSPYSVITPLLSLVSDSSDIGDYAKANVQGNEPFWRMMLYPNGAASYSHRCAGGLRRNRPHSYNGSSGNSFTAAGYVRQCEDTSPSPENNFTNFKFSRNRFNSHHEQDNPPVITYTKLAVDEEGGPTLVETPTASRLNVDDASSGNTIHKCFCKERSNAFTSNESHKRCKCSVEKQNIRRFRGESWYDGYNRNQASLPAIDIGPTTQPNPEEAFAFHPPSYVGQVASYVLAPTTNPNRFISGVTTDCTSDGDFDRNPGSSPNGVGSEIRKCSSGSIDSIDVLYRDVRGNHTSQSHPQLRNNKSHEQLQERCRDFPEQDDSLSYVKQCDTYVTVDEALNIPPDLSLSPGRNGANFLSNSYDDHLDNSTFPQFHFKDGEDTGLPEQSFSLDNAVTHLFHGQNFPSSVAENDPQHLENNEASEFGYITTVEAKDTR